VHAPVLLPSGLRSCTTTSYYFSVDVYGTARLPFFLHQPMIDYFKQLNILIVGNGSASASSTGLASGYNLTLSYLFVVFILFLYRLSVNSNSLYIAITLLILNNSMIYLMDFGIKIYRKMPKFLTQTQQFFQKQAPAENSPPSTSRSLTHNRIGNDGQTFDIGADVELVAVGAEVDLGSRLCR
jgi:hypothetical protein